MLTMNIIHKPVMLDEAVGSLNLSPGMTIVDATIGTGGHSAKIIEKISPGGRLIGIDRDEEAISIAARELDKYSADIDFIHSDFRGIDAVLESLKIEKIDGIIFDLGVSSYQLDTKERGFSFRYDAPLDMRMDKSSYVLACDLVNNLTEKEISDILRAFGQERWHNRIARYLVRERKNNPVATTAQLRDIVLRAIPRRFSNRQNIHPATRTFQALRIAVNRELEALSEALGKIPNLLRSNSRISVISFHSLEDRIVKNNFKANSIDGLYTLITKKPLTASGAQLRSNPRSRSAKMRVAQRA